MLRNIEFKKLGLMPFQEALAYQKKLQHLRMQGKIRDTVLTLSHPRVITRGRRPAEEDFKVSPEALRARGIEIADAGRGGRLTYHGPGQLIGYFIISLAARRLSVPRFVETVERAVIQTLKEFGLITAPREGCPGVWVENRKIASVGFSVSRGITMHGVAINLNPNLADFELIIPCGIEACEMTSIYRETTKRPTFREVEKIFQRKVEEVL